MDRLAVTLGLLSLSLTSACSGPGSSAATDDIDAPDSTGTGDGAEQLCEDNDRVEPNEVPEAASRLSWDELSSLGDGTLHDARVELAAFLCSGEHDWYLIPVAELGYEFHVVTIDGLVGGASFCGHVPSCDGEVLPDAPANTLAIEVYDANSLVLLGADIATNGRVDVDGWGPSFANDLLIHVYGPSAAASYDYELHVGVRSYDGDDECEC